MIKRFSIAILITLGLASCAFADQVNLTSPAGLLGNTHTYSLDGHTITVSGFCAGVPCPLVEVERGPDIFGLGLANDPSGEDEIFVGASTFVQVDVNSWITAGITTLTFQMSSVTLHVESWTVEECGTSGVLCGGGTTGGDELTNHTLSGLTTGTRYIDFIASSGNVLLASLSATAPASAPVPEPSSVALMLLGVGLVFGLRKRNSRSHQLA